MALLVHAFSDFTKDICNFTVVALYGTYDTLHPETIEQCRASTGEKHGSESSLLVVNQAFSAVVHAVGRATNGYVQLEVILITRYKEHVMTSDLVCHIFTELLKHVDMK